jgi:sensor histidine kinase YesM
MAVLTLAATGAAMLFSGVTWQSSWFQVRETFGVSLVFTLCIVPLVAMTMRRVGPAVGGRFHFPFDWAILIAVMVGLALIGSIVAIAVLRAIGYIGPGEFGAWLRGSLRISLIMTLIFGISGTALEAMRARLDQTTLALRTKERDEAEARRLAIEAQLASLESRVNPHFLFNTLNSIAALVPRDPEGAERMTGQLASLMRSALDTAGSPTVPLEDELKVVRDYLDIERVRFGERLRYTFTLDEHALKTPVPRLSLQTLVENSVKFAVSPRPEGATIAVNAQRIDGYVRIEVKDDGPGFGGAGMPTGHGLALLEARLKMIFGDRATLGVENQSGGGARVWLDVPFEK